MRWLSWYAAVMVLGALVYILAAQNIHLKHELNKAEVCNKVFVLYLKHNHGFNINLDRIYEDGVKWVNDPQYQ